MPFQGETVRSQGEIEAAVCDGIAKFQQEFLGRGPRDIHAHLIGSLLVVRLQGVLTPAERQLIAPRHEPLAAAHLGTATGGAAGAGDDGESEPFRGDGHATGPTNSRGAGNDTGNGRFLLKQVRAHMMATGRPRLEALVEEAVGVKLVSVHHDISTVTGEEVLVFSLAAPPACRPKKKI
jgi:hypothetical protein